MKTLVSLCLVCSSLFSLSYPNRRHDVQVDNYHGVEVKDPYRYLEDPNCEDTQLWIKEQNALTFDYLKQIPEREAIRKRLEALFNYERYGTMFQKNGRYFFTKNMGLQNHYVTYTMDQMDGTPEVLFDPNTFSEDGTVSINFFSMSKTGKLAAYGLAQAGSDWTEIKIRDVITKEDLKDHLKWIKFSRTSWLPDETGFYYCRFEQTDDIQAANYNQKIYFHRIGTDQELDTLVYEQPEHKDWVFSPHVSEDGKYLFVTVEKGTSKSTAIFYKEIASDSPVKELIPNFDAYYFYISNEGTKCWFFTNHQAPHFRVISIDLEHPEQTEWKEVIAEREETLTGVMLFGDTFAAHYLKDVCSQVQIFDLEGTYLRTLPLPPLGKVEGFGGSRSDKETFYTFFSFTQPPTFYRYDLTTGESEVVFQTTFPISCDDYETKQVFYKSKDGTSVPMFVMQKKGTPWDGNNPAVLYAYGAHGVNTTPWFTPAILSWLEMGGIYAVANIRGGGEYGKDWHIAGKLLNKQTSLNDYIAAAEWLIEQKATSSSKLAVSGGSSGGMLVSASVIQRPELFGAAIPSVGTMDMLRFHKFTIGWAWVSEYGCSDNPEQFACLYKYSPLHNIRKGVSYPPTLVFAADHDDRVVPAHSYKFAATLQDAQASPAPVLIRIETASGHLGSDKPISKILDEVSDKWAFLSHQFKMQKTDEDSTSSIR